MENENESREIEARGIPAYGGRFVRYNILGNLFEIPSKYVPPINPVGRGAYGIVWYVFFCFISHPLSLSLVRYLFGFRLVSMVDGVLICSVLLDAFCIAYCLGHEVKS